jgi:signal transduction histidine kinase
VSPSPARSHDSARETAPLSAWSALDALDVGVLLLTPDLRVVFANARWAGWHGSDVLPGSAAATLIDEGDALHAMRAAYLDGEARAVSFTLCPAQADVSVRRLFGTVRRGASGLVVEARLEPDDDRLALQDVAHRLAQVNDMAEVLRALCDIASHQCHATGAAVLRTTTAVAEVVAASGDLEPARGRCFDAHGSLLEEALDRDLVVSEENFERSGRPLMHAVPELSLGPVLVAPLRAHGESLGVLAITRGPGGRQFTARERERLRVLADHAALAVHKSLLLQRAQSADRAKGRFLATMSHELRTPLTALAGYGELLADEVIGPLSDTQLDVLDRMRSVTAHLSAMIEEILAFTSLEEGRETVRPTECLAEDLVRAAVAAIEPAAQQKALAVQVVLPDRSIRATTDIDKAQQILVNLLGNAVKFTDQGTVRVTLLRGARSFRLEVADTGIGIPVEELPRLFRPFAQVDTGLTRRHGGTGLGLYIARRLATMLGGHIEVESAPGAGSTFSVVLPLVATP